MNKDELIAEYREEKPEYVDMERRQAELYGDELTAEQEDFMLEECMERERELKNTPTTFEMTIQKLRERRDSEGWTSTRYFEEMEREAKIELDEYKEELKLAYGVN